ncbi:MAG TPA: MetQ/NlpA family ABC transporter substrate-binding protein [Xanthobacteraceae bacterium]|nr:MetQ/NlpA family ABC transporter substrate-binding protein [Xanthobacteraceae bacterium]
MIALPLRPDCACLRTLATAFALALATFSGADAQAPLKVGSGAGPNAEILEFAAAHARKQGLPVDVIEFSDWITPNEAVANGDIDANLFQHKPFLDAAIKARGYKLVPIAVTYVMPVGLFSKKVKSFDAVPAGATVAIANDPVNAARGLRLFAKAGLITLKPDVGDEATVLDITANPKRLKFLELEAPQLPRALDDVAVAQVSYSFVERAHLDPQNALISDGFGDPHYGLQFTVRADRKDDPKITRFVALFRSPEVKAFITEKFGKYIVPLW